MRLDFISILAICLIVTSMIITIDLLIGDLI